MNNQFVGQKITYIEEVESTNSYIFERLKTGSINSGTVVYADIQTKGRGQREKHWTSEAFSNLNASITADVNLWKIKNLISLNHIVSLSVQNVLKKYTSNVRIKWPNDIMINNKKAAGILIENLISSTQRKSVIGIGININQSVFDVPRATSLFLETNKNYPIKEILFELIDSLNLSISEYQSKGEETIFHLFNQQLWKLGEPHVFTENGTTRIGIITETTQQGKLRIKFDNEEKSFSNGEISY